MSLRVKRKGPNIGVAGDDDFTEYTDTSDDQRTAIDNEGYTYIFGINEVRNFADDGRGQSVVNSGTSLNIVADNIPFGNVNS